MNMYGVRASAVHPVAVAVAHKTSCLKMTTAKNRNCFTSFEFMILVIDGILDSNSWVLIVFDCMKD